MFALILSLLLSACDLGTHFSKPDSWTESAVDFAVDHQKDGFGFASQKRDIVNCMKRGACTWHGLEVWETRIYYGADGATRVEMSLYNRGDDKGSDGLDSEGLKKLLDDIAANAQPGGKIGSNPEKKKLKTGGYQFSKKWNKGDCDIDLVWGVDSVKEKDLTADYVRVTMHPKGGAKVKASAKSGGIVSKTKAKSHVKKNADGDVWIDGVPMVDQGQKGYCAAATVARIMGYYGYDFLDQHQIASWAKSDADRGTNEKMLDAIAGVLHDRYKLVYREVPGSVNDFFKLVEDYNKAAKRLKRPEVSLKPMPGTRVIDAGAVWRQFQPDVLREARTRNQTRNNLFFDNIRKSIDAGVPVIWSAMLGLVPEDPPLPQAFGGHMRLIIGYNQRERTILYTDSWGAKHERKTMKLEDAIMITTGLRTIAWTLN